MQCQSGNKVETVQEFESCCNSLHTVYRATNSIYSVNSLATSSEIHMLLIWDIHHIPTSANSSQSATGF